MSGPAKSTKPLLWGHPWECCMGVIIVGISILVGIILGTEWMIRDAASFVQPGESQWTYGQTISLFLSAPNILETFRGLTETRKEQDKDKDKKRVTEGGTEEHIAEHNGGLNPSSRRGRGELEADAGGLV
ncbi:hypothetical protein D9756_003572 [Leucocoprinus leucothites]|uniref:Uncharacterized protein n=1 Tax=Leucocoprinus leucothites TaxID=201217 RepID=A0A8H5G798_9AGAR|nr:hypothetical protein D9756_003572 [Leucoagaricus leucothites]